MIAAASILAALELVLAGGAWLIGARTRRSMALALLCLTAPLEVYRADISVGNLSLFRLSLILGVITLLADNPGEVVAVARRPLVVVYGLLVVVMVVSTATVSSNHHLALVVLGQTLTGLLAAVVVCLLARGLPFWRIAQLIVAGAALPILAAIVVGIAGGNGSSVLPLLDQLPVPHGLEVTRDQLSYLGDTAQRLKGTFGDPNHFGAYLIFVIAFTVGLLSRELRRGGQRWAVIYASGAVAAVVMLVSTFSRSAWGGAVVAAVAAALLALTDRRTWAALRHSWRRVAALCAVVAACIAPLAPSIIDRLDTGERANQRSDQNHTQTTEVAVRDLLHHPVFGIGLSDLGAQLAEGQRTSGAHSSYLTVGAELGGVGLMLLLAALVFTLRALLRARAVLRDSSDAPFVGLLLAAYVGFAFANAFYDFWWDDFHWLVIGAVLSLDIRCASGAVAARPLDARARTPFRSHAARQKVGG